MIAHPMMQSCRPAPLLPSVFITENRTNFLALLRGADAIVVSGAGCSWGALARASSLHRRQLHARGDIDTHGFAILDQLLGDFPGAASFLTDRETLLAHRLRGGDEADAARHDLADLAPEKTGVYENPGFDRSRPQL